MALAKAHPVGAGAGATAPTPDPNLAALQAYFDALMQPAGATPAQLEAAREALANLQAGAQPQPPGPGVWVSDKGAAFIGIGGALLGGVGGYLLGKNEKPALKAAPAKEPRRIRAKTKKPEPQDEED